MTLSQEKIKKIHEFVEERTVYFLTMSNTSNNMDFNRKLNSNLNYDSPVYMRGIQKVNRKCVMQDYV